ncbi:hypothetical protein Tco_0897668 [Tanacetum coccineum]
MFWKSSPIPTTSMEPLKVLRAGRLIRHKELEIEDSDVGDICGSAKGTSKDKGGSHYDKKKQKRYVYDDTDAE